MKQIEDFQKSSFNVLCGFDIRDIPLNYVFRNKDLIWFELGDSAPLILSIVRLPRYKLPTLV